MKVLYRIVAAILAFCIINSCSVLSKVAGSGNGNQNGLATGLALLGLYKAIKGANTGSTAPVNANNLDLSNTTNLLNPAEPRPAPHRCQHPSERDSELHLAVLQRTDQRLLQPGEPEQRVEHHFQPAGPEQHQQFSPSGRRPDAADQERDDNDPGRHNPDDRRFRDPLRPHGDPRPVEIKGITSPSPRGPHRR